MRSAAHKHRFILLRFIVATLFMGLSAAVLLIVFALPSASVSVAHAQGPTPTSQPTAVPVSPNPGLSAEAILARAEEIEKRAADVVNTVNVAFGVVQAVGVLVGLVGAIVAAAAFTLGVTGYRQSQSQQAKANEAIENARKIAAQIQPLQARIETELKTVSVALEQFKVLQTDVDALVKNENQEMEALLRTRLENETNLIQLVQGAEAKLQKESNRASRALAYTQLAQRQFSLGNRESAIQSLRLALKLDPDNPIIAYFLGDILARSDQEGAAIKHLRNARRGGLIEADLSFAYALRLKGDNQRVETDREALYARSATIFLKHWANPKLKNLIDISGESAFGALGGMYKRQKRWHEAIVVYRYIAENVTPQSSYPVNNLALLSLQVEDEDGAMRAFARSRQIARTKLAVDPNDVYARFDVITAEVALQKDDSPELLAEILGELDEVFTLVQTPGPLLKLLGGLDNLTGIAASRPCYAPVRDRIEQQVRALTPTPTPDEAT